MGASGIGRLLCRVRVPEVLTHVSQVAGRRDAEFPRRDADGKPSAHDALKLPMINAQARSPESFSFGASASKTGTDPFHDQASLKLSDGRDDREHRLTQRRAGVDLLAERDELDVEMPKEFQHLDQMTNGPPKAVESGD